MKISEKDLDYKELKKFKNGKIVSFEENCKKIILKVAFKYDL